MTFEQYLAKDGLTIEQYQQLDNDSRLGYLRGYQSYNLLNALDMAKKLSTSTSKEDKC